jgi:YebC/PmpR family DNA-binding regulatory protein
MSGHSKWANIKHKKAAADAKKGNVFSKLAREIMVAARSGSDLSANVTLRSLIQKARGVNMPADNIDRAIKKGTGELAGEALEEKMYEGFGPGGIQIVIQALTDNNNRTTAEIRHLLGKHGGRMGVGGCVAHMFDRKGFLTVEKGKVEEDRLIEIALDGGADDVSSEEPDVFEVYTPPADFYAVQKALEAAQIPIASAELSRIPQNTTPVGTQREAEQILRIMELLEDHDDVQKVWSNFDIPAEMLEKLSG